MQELFQHTLNFEELSLVYFGSIFIFLAYYVQYTTILKYANNETMHKDLLNIDLIRAQLIALKEDLSGNRVILYLFPISMLIVSFLIVLLDIGGSWKYLWVGLTAFLLLQSFLEYHLLFLTILSKTELENKSINQVLEEMETSSKMKEIYIMKDASKKMKEEEPLIQETINKINNTNNIVYNFSKNSKNLIKYKDNENDILFETEDKRIFIISLIEDNSISIEEIIEVNSMYFNSFYESVTIKEMFFKLWGEPLIVFLLLFSIVYFGGQS